MVEAVLADAAVVTFDDDLLALLSFLNKKSVNGRMMMDSLDMAVIGGGGGGDVDRIDGCVCGGCFCCEGCC